MSYLGVLERDPAHTEALDFVTGALRDRRNWRQLRAVLSSAADVVGLDAARRRTLLEEVARLCEHELRDWGGAAAAWQRLHELDPGNAAARAKLLRSVGRLGPRGDSLRERVLAEAGAAPAAAPAAAPPAAPAAAPPAPTRPRPGLPAAAGRRAVAAGDILCDEYRLERHLGRGSFGDVWLVRSRLTDAVYAVKMLVPERVGSGLERKAFLAELQTWVDLPPHPHVARCYFIRAVDESECVFAEYLEGGTLLEWAASGRIGSADNAIDLAVDLARGLHAAHRQGLVHADVKPGNALMTGDGRAKVTDFGLTTDAGRRAASLTPAYGSPEQAARAPLTPASDIWSWGLTLLTLFARECFWRCGGDRAVEILERALREPALFQFPLLPAVEAVLRRCFVAEPARRWPSLSAAIAALGREAPPEVGRPPRAPGEPSRAAHWLGVLASEATRIEPPRARLTPTAQALEEVRVYRELAGPLERSSLPAWQRAELHRDWARAWVALGEHDQAREASARQEALLEPDSATAAGAQRLAAALVARADIETRRGDGAAAFAACRRAVDLLAKHQASADDEHRRGLARALVKMAAILRGGASFDQAVEVAQLAVDVAELQRTSASDPLLLADALAERGTALKYAKKDEEAASDLLRAIELYEAASASKFVTATRMTLTNALRDLGRHDEARREITQAIDAMEADPGGDGLLIAYQCRANLHERRLAWGDALADRERIVSQLERDAVEHGRQDSLRLLARTRLAATSALNQLAKKDAALAMCQRAVALLERLRAAGKRWDVGSDLTDGYRLLGACQRDLGLRHDAARSLAAAATLALGTWKAQDTPETRLGFGLLGVQAAQARALAGETDAALATLDQAMTALAPLAASVPLPQLKSALRDAVTLAVDQLEACSDPSRHLQLIASAKRFWARETGPDAPARVSRLGRIDALPRASAGNDEEEDLAQAIVRLLQGQGAEAKALAERWSSWRARCISFLARTFFLFDATGAFELFGGTKAVEELARSDRPERHFLKGFSAILRKDRDEAFASFKRGAELTGDDPFFLFGMIQAIGTFGGTPAAMNAVATTFHRKHPTHPLYRMTFEQQ